MALFDDDDAQSFQTNGSGFQFSGANIDTLGASEYTLVGIGADRSGSVTYFAKEIEGCLRSALEGCQKSPRVDNLLVRLVTFGGQFSGRKAVHEEHGFRALKDCHLNNYQNFLNPGGGTPLYDASVDSVDSLATYGKELISRDYTANGLVCIITDGIDEGSTLNVKHVKEAFARALQSEALESLMSILIGINVTTPGVSQYLNQFKDEAGFMQYIEAKDASPATFAKIGGFISKSVSSQSQAIRSGAASQLITF